MSKIVSDFCMGKETGGPKNETYTLTYGSVILSILLYSRILLWYIVLLIWWKTKQLWSIKTTAIREEAQPHT